MRVFEINNGTAGFDELMHYVEAAKELGRGIRVGIDGDELKLCVGQGMWSLPVAVAPKGD